MAQEVLSEYLRHFVLVYLDDIIVYSANAQEHLYHLRLVFERLEQYGLKCSEAQMHRHQQRYARCYRG